MDKEERKTQSTALGRPEFGSGVLGTRKRDKEEVAGIEGAALQECVVMTATGRRNSRCREGSQINAIKRSIERGLNLATRESW